MASEKYWKQSAFISNRTFSKNKKRSGTTVPGWCSTWFFKENITLVFRLHIYIIYKWMPYDLLTMCSNIDLHHILESDAIGGKKQAVKKRYSTLMSR